MSKKRYLVFIVNPISGTDNKQHVLEIIAQNINNNIFDWKIIQTQYAGHASVIAKEQVALGCDAIIAVGGDGTINEVASSIRHTNTALGIIPCGSGNGLARHLFIPMHPQGAIEIINRFFIKDLDYGIINDRPFFCTCGIGFDAFISYRFAQSKRRGLFTYIENTLREGLCYHPETYDIIINDDSEHCYKAFLITCANASQYGNNVYIAPHASMNDGLMDVTILKPFKLLEAPKIVYDLFMGSIDKNSKTQTIRCKKLCIKQQQARVIHFDGDPVMVDSDIEIRIIERGIKMIVNSNGISNRNPLLQIFSEYYNNMLRFGKDIIQSGGSCLSQKLKQ